MPRPEIVPIAPEVIQLPLAQSMSGVRSIRRAMTLRAQGLTYTAISTTMRVYHGDDRSVEAWRSTLRASGVAPRVRAA